MLSGKGSRDLGDFKRGLTNRIGQIRATIAERVAEILAEEIRKKIPKGGGWLDIYRAAITFVKDGDGWSVKGIAKVELTQIPAETTLLTFAGDTNSAAFMRSFEPWTVDAVLALRSGIVATVTALPSSLGEVDAHRRRLAGLQSDIQTRARSFSLEIMKDERPVMNGEIVADINFLSKRLEMGLGGFPRIPHWQPAISKVKNSGAGPLRADRATRDKLKEAME